MSYLLLENSSKILLESSFGLLSQANSSGTAFYPNLPSQGYWGTPFYVSPNIAKGIINNGGTVLGVPLTTLQTTRIFESDYGFINTGKHNYVGSPVRPANTIKAISVGTFGVIIADQYILMTFTSQIAGRKNGILTSPAGGRSFGNINHPYVNTRLDAKTGGWYYMNGQPVNPQYQSDYIGTDNGKNRFTFLQSGGKIPTSSSYNIKTD